MTWDRFIEIFPTVAPLAGIAALLGTYLLWQKDRRESQKDAAAIAALWRKAAKEDAEAAADLRLQLAEVRAEVNDLRREQGEGQVELAALRSDLTSLEVTEHQLIQWVVLLHTGIQNGTIPPLPDIPLTIATILARLHMRAIEDLEKP